MLSKLFTSNRVKELEQTVYKQVQLLAERGRTIRELCEQIGQNKKKAEQQRKALVRQLTAIHEEKYTKLLHKCQTLEDKYNDLNQGRVKPFITYKEPYKTLEEELEDAQSPYLEMFTDEPTQSPETRPYKALEGASMAAPFAYLEAYYKGLHQGLEPSHPTASDEGTL